LIGTKKIKFDEITEINLKEKLLNFKVGSLIIIYDAVVFLCRRGNKNISIMIPEVQLNNLKIYVEKYLN
jgi:hypothetical protein